MCSKAIASVSNIALEQMMKELKLPSTCMIKGCDFSSDLETVQRHEEDCPFRIVKCVVLDCHKDIPFNSIEEHVVQNHPDMTSGEWVIRQFRGNSDAAKVLHQICPRRHNGGRQMGMVFTGAMATNVNNPINFAMRTWRFSGTRFFASLILKNHGSSCQNCGYTGNSNNITHWNIWVTAACGKLEASKFRSEIRLASNNQPEYTVVSHRPILHFESDILSTSDLSTYPACLEVSGRTVANYIADKNGTELKDGREIPFSCRVHEKVFLNLGKADIAEKEDAADAATLENHKDDEEDEEDLFD